MAIHTRPNHLPLTTGIETGHIYATSRLVSSITPL